MPYTSQKFLSVSTADSRCDVPYMRVAEMYLIEAEAKAKLGAADALKFYFLSLAKEILHMCCQQKLDKL
ncbi:RagB/SusD family nutrient uptake outer membrane protein [Flavobacterium branchiarum]|uniref:RagB/SusD family nutrient uptake outer membrane protein n=1 Tax=Flavobacterium branchiarum TaxID=1114870 RepID=UPI0025B5EE02|nr:RagB/SusD family nutrient uptake outer membrane protein [Flavobacterium branchiarum]MDN3671471.1 RagB/SusD family nutrient uptake outer membrane protein [Flavobacterium branchiarum]